MKKVYVILTETNATEPIIHGVYPSKAQAERSSEALQLSLGLEPEPWTMTLAEWLAAPRVWELPPVPMSLEAWRGRHGFSNVLDDHGDFRHPHGISKATRRRMRQRLADRWDSMVEGAKQYEAALAAGEVPLVPRRYEYRGDGTDLECNAAAARVRHRRSVMAAIYHGEQVPEQVLADYPTFVASRTGAMGESS